MKPIYIIQIGFSAVKDLRKWQGIHYGCAGSKRVATLEDLFHTAVLLTSVLKDSEQTHPIDLRIWVRVP